MHEDQIIVHFQNTVELENTKTLKYSLTLL